jgi:DNA-binding phage protein
MKPRGWHPPLADSMGRVRGGRWRGKHIVPERAHPFVRRMFEIINQEGCTLEELAARSGVDSQAMNSWRSRKSPQLVTFEAVLNALGYQLRIVAIKDEAGA